MKIHFLTEDKIEEFNNEFNNLNNKISSLEKLTNVDMWKNEL